jgi:hypothetical protein
MVVVSLNEMFRSTDSFWTLLQGKYNCSLDSESLATTYWSDTYSMEDFVPWKQEWYESQVQGRRRLGANGTEYGPAVAPEVYNTYFLVSSRILLVSIGLSSDLAMKCAVKAGYLLEFLPSLSAHR